MNKKDRLLDDYRNTLYGEICDNMTYRLEEIIEEAKTLKDEYPDIMDELRAILHDFIG